MLLPVDPQEGQLLDIPPGLEGSLPVLLLLGSRPLELLLLGSPQEGHLEHLDSQQGELQGPLGSLQEVLLQGSPPEVLHSLQVPPLHLGSPLQVPQAEGRLGSLLLDILTSLEGKEQVYLGGNMGGSTLRQGQEGSGEASPKNTGVHYHWDY